MGSRLVPLLLVVVLAGACGKEIGDACTYASDCSPNGNRICDPDPSSPGGYCTVMGCDDSSCPGEAACIRFFTGSFSNKTCTNSPDECSLDELCSLGGSCVPRSSEVRYCMRTCDSDGDCRDGYECRDLDKMKRDGGEPVLAPVCTTVNGQESCSPAPIDAHAPKFCAAKPTSS